MLTKHEEYRKTLELLLEGSPCAIADFAFGVEPGNEVGPIAVSFSALVGISEGIATQTIKADVRRASCRLPDDFSGWVTAYVSFEYDPDPDWDELLVDYVEVRNTEPTPTEPVHDAPIEF